MVLHGGFIYYNPVSPIACWVRFWLKCAEEGIYAREGIRGSRAVFFTDARCFAQPVYVYHACYTFKYQVLLSRA